MAAEPYRGAEVRVRRTSSSAPPRIKQKASSREAAILGSGGSRSRRAIIPPRIGMTLDRVPLSAKTIEVRFPRNAPSSTKNPAVLAVRVNGR